MSSSEEAKQKVIKMMPPGFMEILKNVAKTVMVNQPDNIYLHVAQKLEKDLENRAIQEMEQTGDSQQGSSVDPESKEVTNMVSKASHLAVEEELQESAPSKQGETAADSPHPPLHKTESVTNLKDEVDHEAAAAVEAKQSSEVQLLANAASDPARHKLSDTKKPEKVDSAPVQTKPTEVATTTTHYEELYKPKTILIYPTNNPPRDLYRFLNSDERLSHRIYYTNQFLENQGGKGLTISTSSWLEDPRNQVFHISDRITMYINRDDTGVSQIADMKGTILDLKKVDAVVVISLEEIEKVTSLVIESIIPDIKDLELELSKSNIEANDVNSDSKNETEKEELIENQTDEEVGEPKVDGEEKAAVEANAEERRDDDKNEDETGTVPEEKETSGGQEENPNVIDSMSSFFEESEEEEDAMSAEEEKNTDSEQNKGETESSEKQETEANDDDAGRTEKDEESEDTGKAIESHPDEEKEDNTEDLSNHDEKAKTEENEEPISPALSSSSWFEQENLPNADRQLRSPTLSHSSWLDEDPSKEAKDDNQAVDKDVKTTQKENENSEKDAETAEKDENSAEKKSSSKTDLSEEGDDKEETEDQKDETEHQNITDTESELEDFESEPELPHDE